MDENYQQSTQPDANDQTNKVATYFSQPKTVTDLMWCTNSGATNHITGDLENLTLR